MVDVVVTPQNFGAIAAGAVLAGPAAGTAQAPSFRPLAAADIPTAGLTAPRSFEGAGGTIQMDASANTISLTNGAAVNFTAMSGLIAVNNHTTGLMTLYMCGGGVTVAISSLAAQVGTLTFNGGLNAYVFTNTGALGTFSFLVFKTRAAV